MSKLYKAHFKGFSRDITLDIYADNMKRAWEIARSYKISMMLDEVYPTDNNWS